MVGPFALLTPAHQSGGSSNVRPGLEGLSGGQTGWIRRRDFGGGQEICSVSSFAGPLPPSSQARRSEGSPPPPPPAALGGGGEWRTQGPRARLLDVSSSPYPPGLTRGKVNTGDRRNTGEGTTNNKFKWNRFDRFPTLRLVPEEFHQVCRTLYKVVDATIFTDCAD